MLYLLGLLCVGWTVHELVNLQRRSRDANRKGEIVSEDFVAWDDAGCPLHVEELPLR